MFTSPADIAFRVGNVSVYYYGIIMALAILTGIIVSQKIADKYYTDLPDNLIIDAALPTVVCGILGARIYYCALAWTFYSQHPLSIFFLREGGLSVHGALLGGFIGVVLYAKAAKISILKLCDLLSLGTILAQAIGRWGNFFNSEAFGSQTNLPWKIFIPYAQRPLGLEKISFYHPTFLYESIADILIFLILFFVLKKFKKNSDGTIFAIYLILYSVARFFIEGIRVDSVLNILTIPIAQIVCVIGILIGAAILVLTKRKSLS